MTMKRALLTLALGVSLGIVAPVAATATPTTYGFTSGSVTVSGTAGSTVLFGDTIPLSGTSVTFDAAVPSVLSILLAGGTATATPLSAAFGGFDEFTLTSFTISPSATYTNISTTPGGLPGTFSFVVGPVDVVGFALAHDTTGTLPDTVIPFAFANPTVAGSIDLGAGTLSLTGITLASIVVPGESDPLVVKADILFTGFEVPEPSTLGLLGLGAAVIVRRSRRSA